MNTIPVVAFNGYLKQLQFETLQQDDKRLVAYLLPKFLGDPVYHKNFTHNLANRKDDHLKKLLESDETARLLYEQMINSASQVDTTSVPRRFSGINFPRNRYYTIANDRGGNDKNCLCNELRAYRNPMVGRIEILDFTGDTNDMAPCFQCINPGKSAIIFVLHDLEYLSDHFYGLANLHITQINGESVGVYLLFYKIIETSIHNVIDLRFPHVRDWFYNQFKRPYDIPSQNESILAFSQFDFRLGQAMVPRNFWDMLPTLINPDIGGGVIGSAGESNNYVANWMRNHDIDALIYPSARSDVSVQITSGKLTTFSGWNLVNYRDSPVFNKRSIFFHNTSPWGWQTFVKNVNLIKPSLLSEEKGSFSIVGVENYLQDIYRTQLNALESSHRVFGDERRAESDIIPNRIWWISIYSLYWIIEYMERKEANEIETLIAELNGLAIPYDLYDMTGRVQEILEAVQENDTEISNAISGCIEINRRIGKYLDTKYPKRNFSFLIGIANDTCLAVIMATAFYTKYESAISNKTYYTLLPKNTNYSNCQYLPNFMAVDLFNYLANYTLNRESETEEIRNYMEFGKELVSRVSKYSMSNYERLELI